MGFKPKFIYFDLDDTLLDHTRAEEEALRDVHRHFDLFQSADVDELIEVYHKVNSRQWVLYSQGEVTREQLQRNRFEQTLQQLSVDKSQHRQVSDRYMDFYRNHWEWVDGAESAFRKVRDEYEVGILTNGFAETQRKKFERFNLHDQAHQLVISEEVGALKPHPSVFAHATELTGYPPEDILYIGDSYRSDVIGGTDFGWKVAWFTQNGEAEKRKQADFVFENFNELTNALNVAGIKSKV